MTHDWRVPLMILVMLGSLACSDRTVSEPNQPTVVLKERTQIERRAIVTFSIRRPDGTWSTRSRAGIVVGVIERGSAMGRFVSRPSPVSLPPSADGVRFSHETGGTSDCDAACEAQADSIFERFQIEMATTSPTIGAEDWTETDPETGHVVRFVTYAGAGEPATAHTQYVDQALTADARYSWETVSGGWMLKRHAITGYYDGQETWKASAEFVDGGPAAYNITTAPFSLRSLASSLGVRSSCLAGRVVGVILPKAAWAQAACQQERNDRRMAGIGFALGAAFFGAAPSPASVISFYFAYDSFWRANRNYYQCLGGSGGASREEPQ